MRMSANSFSPLTVLNGVFLQVVSTGHRMRRVGIVHFFWWWSRAYDIIQRRSFADVLRRFRFVWGTNEGVSLGEGWEMRRAGG